MPGRMEFEFTSGGQPGAKGRRTDAGDPMRILVLGDFSGRRNRGAMEVGADLMGRPVLSVDVDNFDERMQRIAPRLSLPVGEGGEGTVDLEFETLESFHPDELFDRLDLFQALRRSRKMLGNEDTFAQAAAELRLQEAAPPAGADPVGSEAPAAPSAEDDGSTLERLLGSAPARSSPEGPATRKGGVNIERLIQGIVGPHIVPSPDPRQDQMIAAVDRGLSALMGDVLHHPDFQAIESAWRGVWSLITGVETGEELTLHMLDVSKEEIAADFANCGGDLTRSGLHQLLVEKHVEVAGGVPWSVLVVDAAFGPSPDDVAALAALGALASRAGGPVLAGAVPAVLGLDALPGALEPRDWPGPGEDAAALWQAFRETPAAHWVGLALPRLLMRLPYGRQTEELDRFEYEELGPDRTHESYLWGNPAYGLALLLGRAFTARGWSMQPGDVLDVEDLPAHTFVEDGEKGMQACAEVYFSERAADAVLGFGVMPLMSYKNRDAARVARFQSVASPPSGLAGPW